MDNEDKLRANRVVNFLVGEIEKKNKESTLSKSPAVLRHELSGVFFLLRSLDRTFADNLAKEYQV